MRCYVALPTKLNARLVMFILKTEVFKPRDNANLIDETLSLDEEIHAGEFYMIRWWRAAAQNSCITVIFKRVVTSLS